MNDEYYRDLLNKIHEDQASVKISRKELMQLVLWLEAKHDAVRNEAIARISDIGMLAFKALKETL